MKKSEIIDAVAYAMAPEGGLAVRKAVAEGEDMSKAAAALTQSEREIMSFCKFLAKALQVATDEFPDYPTIRLFERIRFTVGTFREPILGSPGFKEESRERFEKTMKKISELAKELRIPYDEPKK